MRVKWEHRLTVERKKGAEKLISDYVTAWIRQGFKVEREENSAEIRISAAQEFEWGEDKI